MRKSISHIQKIVTERTDWVKRLPLRKNIEAVWMEHEKEADIMQTDNEPEIAGYKKSAEHPAYNIEFFKNNIDKVIQNTGSDKHSIWSCNFWYYCLFCWITINCPLICGSVDD